jgi:selenide,water dikinase
VGGVELTLNMQMRLWQLLDRLGRSRQDLTLHLFHRGAEIANGRNRSTPPPLAPPICRTGGAIASAGNPFARCEPLAAGERRRVRCESGLTVDCDRVFWVTNAAAPQLDKAVRVGHR